MDLLDDEALLDLRKRAKATDPAAVLAEERRQRDLASLHVPPEPTRGSGAARAVPFLQELADPAATRSTPPAAASAGSTPAGLCGVCGTRPARDRCTSCGRPACAADLWIMLRLCRGCASDGDVARGQRGARVASTNWLAGQGDGGQGSGGAR